MIDVTAAIIYKDNKFLICQRPKGKRCELLWEFPGGKVEYGERLEEGVIRECYEELGVIIKPEKLFCIVNYEYPDIIVNIHFYICKIIEGKPICIEHNELQWLTLDEIIKLPLCPADEDMLSIEGKNLCMKNDYLG